MKRISAIIAANLLFLSAPSIAQKSGDTDETQEFASDIIHSDLPLYSFDWEGLWPRPFFSEDSFGCQSRIRTGDWQFLPSPEKPDAAPYWLNYKIHGAIHCYGSLTPSSTKNTNPVHGLGAIGRLSGAGFFVRLGETEVDGQIWEI